MQKKSRSTVINTYKDKEKKKLNSGEKSLNNTTGSGSETAVKGGLKKNDEVILDITDLGNEGEGIGKINGFTLFVKGTVPGDRIRCGITKLKKNYGYGRVTEIIVSSPERAVPVCPNFGKCGGCSLQHMTYESQLKWKESKVLNCLTRIGGISEKDFIYEPILGMKSCDSMPLRYRNKGQFPVGRDRNGNAVTGFYAPRSHRIVPVSDCVIQDECTAIINQIVLDFINRNSVSVYDEIRHEGLVRHIVLRTGKHTGEVMVCIVINGKTLPHREELVNTLLKVDLPAGQKIVSIVLNVNRSSGNKILGDRNTVIYGREYIRDKIGNLVFRISPLSFFQVNAYQTEILYRQAMKYADIKPGETVFDLYCGTGTLSLFAAERALKVTGVEIVEDAVKDARINARENGITNVEFIAGAAETVVPELYGESGGTFRADLVILDPPRKGCDEKLVQTVASMNPERIVYVSCDPATLARDCGRFSKLGYFLSKARACDMFALTGGVETVALLNKKVTSGQTA